MYFYIWMEISHSHIQMKKGWTLTACPSGSSKVYLMAENNKDCVDMTKGSIQGWLVRDVQLSVEKGNWVKWYKLAGSLSEWSWTGAVSMTMSEGWREVAMARGHVEICLFSRMNVATLLACWLATWLVSDRR